MNHNKKTKRPVDILGEEVNSLFKNSWTFVKKTELSYFRFFLIIAFVIGLACALVWSISLDLHSESDASSRFPNVLIKNKKPKSTKKNKSSNSVNSPIANSPGNLPPNPEIKSFSRPTRPIEIPNPKTLLPTPLPPPTPPEIKNLNFPETGGSNYLTYTVGAFKLNGGDYNYLNQVKSVIANYNENPKLIENQLKTMYAGGQRQITLILWYIESDYPQSSFPYSYAVIPQNAHLSPQKEKNLRDLLAKIKEIGFQKIYFRFSSQGSAYPMNWSSWDETKYQNNWNFIKNTRTAIKDELKDSVPVIFDLDVEYGGVDSGQAKTYSKKLWADYTNNFGVSDTYGFTISPVPGRVTEMIKMFDSVGKRPPMYAFDVYGKMGTNLDEYQQLQYLSEELAKAGEIEKPVLIQESFENNTSAYFNFLRAKKDFNIKITSIFQFPYDIDFGTENWSHQCYFTTDYAPNYSAYLTGGALKAPDNCIFGSNENICSVTIKWSSIYDSSCIFVKVNSETEKKLFACGKAGIQEAPWITGSGAVFELRKSNDPNSDLLDRKEISGLKPFIKGIPENCQLNGSSTCTSQIFWNAPSSNICVFVDGKIFSCGLKEFSQEAPWITKNGFKFELRAGSNPQSPLLGSTTVKGF